MKNERTRAAFGNKKWLRFSPYVVLGLFLVILPPFLDISFISLLTKILIFGLLAMSLDLVFGYTGLWSFGHAAIFGAAAYCAGILTTHYNISSFWLLAPASILMGGVVAAIFALIAIRVSSFYFLLVTLALGQLVFGIVSKWRTVTGGSDGLGGVPYPDMSFPFLPIHFSPTNYYYLTLILFVICAVLLYLLVNSAFGHSLQGIRENEIRMRCLGYNTWLFKYMSFVISGLFAGMAGLLYICYNGLIAPNDVNFLASGSLMLMIIIGGTGTLWGGLVGSGVILSLQYFIGLITPERWPLIMGIAFAAVVMFLRGGIFPYLHKLWMKVSHYDRA